MLVPGIASAPQDTPGLDVLFRIVTPPPLYFALCFIGSISPLRSVRGLGHPNKQTSQPLAAKCGIEYPKGYPVPFLADNRNKKFYMKYICIQELLLEKFKINVDI